MRPLDAEAIQAMKKLTGESTQPCPLYAFEFDDILVVTNNSIILQWPRDEVEECSQLSKLLDTRSDKLAADHAKNLSAEHWSIPVFREGGKFIDAKEVDPEDDELGQIVYTYRRSRIRYGWYNFSIVELFLDDPTYRIYVHSEFPIMRAMAVYDGDELVGAFMNNRQENE